VLSVEAADANDHTKKWRRESGSGQERSRNLTWNRRAERVC